MHAFWSIHLSAWIQTVLDRCAGLKGICNFHKEPKCPGNNTWMTVGQKNLAGGLASKLYHACILQICLIRHNEIEANRVSSHHTKSNGMETTNEILFCLHLEYPRISLAFLVLLHSFSRSLSFVRTFWSLSFVKTFRGLCFVSIFRSISFVSTVRNFLRNFRGRRSIDR